MPIQYNSVPTLAQWEKDSSVTFAIRNNDQILKRIDFLVGSYNRAAGDDFARALIHADLYFVTDYWLKNCQRSGKMERGRQPAVYALFVCVVNELCQQFGVTVNVLPRELEMMFGRVLSDVGVKVDSEEERARYLKRKDIEKYRVWFKNGRAYQADWWKKNSKGRIKPVSSARAYNPKAFVKSNDGTRFDNENYGPFIMTMGREIYMMTHNPGRYGEQEGIYHSSYLAGGAVSCAGSMLIVDGRIKRIRTDSGHYKPTPSNTLAFLLTLRMFGVPLEDVWVEDFEGRMAVTAMQFLKCGANWTSLMRLMGANEQEQKLNKTMEKLKRDQANAIRIQQQPAQQVPNPALTGSNSGNQQDYYQTQ
ncbi:MAG: hypothetical protein U0Q16_09655 [Bryobacteraceae bacterium]